MSKVEQRYARKRGFVRCRSRRYVSSGRSAEQPSTVVPDAKQSGGEPDGIVQVANLVYAGTKSSRCFSDHFLIRAEKESVPVEGEGGGA